MVGLEAEHLQAFASIPLVAFFYLFGQFAITECKRVLDLPPGVGGMPKAPGGAARLEAWLKTHSDMPGAPFLQAMVPTTRAAAGTRS